MNQPITLNKHTPLNGALNFSYLLDAPAGKHGFVQAKEGHLFYEDGTRAKFIGFNFPVRSGLPDHESAQKYAERLAGLGVNVVRIHAIDAMPSDDPDAWSTEPDMPFIEYRDGSSRRLNPEALERLDYFAFLLKERGIYLHIDLKVARGFVDGDDLDYSAELPVHGKSISTFNRRLIELQKEYATCYLKHVNQYTGLSYVDDPAVMTIQIINEDSVFFCTEKIKARPQCQPYFEELRRRFNHYLLSKYDTAQHLREAWTFEGQCALLEGEDPEQGTVQLIRLDIDDMWPNINDPLGPWVGLNSPARYADFNEFGIMISRDYYGEMIDHVRSLGAKVPIATSNLVHGAVDVYCAGDGDTMQNNGYFNHPFFGELPDKRDMITSDPRFFSVARPPIQAGPQIMQVAAGVVKGKPFAITEWNEYGSLAYHSASFLMTAAYACLQDWDAMILYCYQTQGKDCYDQPDDFVSNVMESYNDPAVICQHGVMAAMFLQGMIRPAVNTIDLCFTMDDLRLMPPSYPLPFGFLPYISKVGTVFLNQGNVYDGDGDVAVSGGHTSTGDFTNAKHAVVWANTPYADGYRHSYLGKAYLDSQRGENAAPLMDMATLSDTALVIDDVKKMLDLSDLTYFSQLTDAAMKHWGILGPERGLVDNKTMVSDTGEITYTPSDARFIALSPKIAVFAGEAKAEQVHMGRFTVAIKNDRMTLSILPIDGKGLASSKHMVITAVGNCGNDENYFEGKKLILKGKLYIDSWEGGLTITDCDQAELFALDLYGSRIAQIPTGRTQDGRITFEVDGSYAAANYELIIE